MEEREDMRISDAKSEAVENRKNIWLLRITVPMSSRSHADEVSKLTKNSSTLVIAYSPCA